MGGTTMITVAPTGAESAKADVPNLPVTLDELLATAKACEAAGAAMIRRRHRPVRRSTRRPRRRTRFLLAHVWHCQLR